MLYILLLMYFINIPYCFVSDLNNIVNLTPTDTIQEIHLQKIPLQRVACKDYFVQVDQVTINNKWHLVTTFYDPSTKNSFSKIYPDTSIELMKGEASSYFAITPEITTNNVIFKYTLSDGIKEIISMHIVNEKGRHFSSTSSVLLAAEKITVHPKNEKIFFSLFKKTKSDGDIIKIKKCVMHDELRSVNSKTIYRKKAKKIELFDHNYAFSINPQTDFLHIVYRIDNVLYKAKYHTFTKEVNVGEYASNVIGIRPSLFTTQTNDRLELHTVYADNIDQETFLLIRANESTNCKIDPFIKNNAPISANLNIGAIILKGFRGIKKCIAFFDPKNMLVQKYVVLTGEFQEYSRIYFTGNEQFLLMTDNNESFCIDLTQNFSTKS